MYWKGLCSVNCELNSILVHEQAFDRLKGEDVSIEGSGYVVRLVGSKLCHSDIDA